MAPTILLSNAIPNWDLGLFPQPINSYRHGLVAMHIYLLGYILIAISVDFIIQWITPSTLLFFLYISC